MPPACTSNFMETGVAPEQSRPPSFGPGHTLSSELKAVTALFSHGEVTLREVLDRLGANASGWIVLLFSLPFCAPITIPGLSTPFGLAIAVIMARFALGKPAWLPQRLLKVKLPPKFFRTVAKGTERFIGWFEKRIHPRWNWACQPDSRLRLHGWSLCVSALLLALPLGGIPFTNTLPGLALFIGIIGIMERDGLALMISHALLLGTLIYFGCFAAIFVEMMQHLISWWRV